MTPSVSVSTQCKEIIEIYILLNQIQFYNSTIDPDVWYLDSKRPPENFWLVTDCICVLVWGDKIKWHETARDLATATCISGVLNYTLDHFSQNLLTRRYRSTIQNSYHRGYWGVRGVGIRGNDLRVSDARVTKQKSRINRLLGIYGQLSEMPTLQYANLPSSSCHLAAVPSYMAYFWQCCRRHTT